MTRPRVSGSSKSMMIISPWAKVENRAIAVPVETRGHVFLPRDGAILRLAWLTACEQPVKNASGNRINGARKSHHLRHLAIGRRMRRRPTARLSPLFKAAKRSPDWPLSALP
jgi:hypothetical protein